MSLPMQSIRRIEKFPIVLILKDQMQRLMLLGEIQTSGQRANQVMKVRQGIDKETASKIVKAIKSSKMKVQAAIQGEQVRITGKKRDDLQDAIGMLKGGDFGLPMQYINFRD